MAEIVQQLDEAIGSARKGACPAPANTSRRAFGRLVARDSPPRAGSGVTRQRSCLVVALAEQGHEALQGLFRLTRDAVRKTVEQGRCLCFRPTAALRETGGGADQHQAGDALRRE
jgi:hypothetical protein